MADAGRVQSQVEEPCEGFDSDGVPFGDCANCGLARGVHPPASGRVASGETPPMTRYVIVQQEYQAEPSAVYGPFETEADAQAWLALAPADVAGWPLVLPLTPPARKPS